MAHLQPAAKMCGESDYLHRNVLELISPSQKKKCIAYGAYAYGYRSLRARGGARCSYSKSLFHTVHLKS